MIIDLMRIQDAGYGIRDAGYGIRDAGYGIFQIRKDFTHFGYPASRIMHHVMFFKKNITILHQISYYFF